MQPILSSNDNNNLMLAARLDWFFQASKWRNTHNFLLSRLFILISRISVVLKTRFKLGRLGFFLDGNEDHYRYQILAVPIITIIIIEIRTIIAVLTFEIFHQLTVQLGESRKSYNLCRFEEKCMTFKIIRF